jgi:hypothetical protein
MLIPLLVAGCATARQVAVQAPPPVLIDAATSTKFVETRYEVRSYREAAHPQLRHEAHAVYRRTVVPINFSGTFETEPRSTYAPPSIAPLPASGELAAELATQRAITEDMRAMQSSMVATQRKMQEQYAQLVRQTGEVVTVREKLEADRSQPATPLAPVPNPTNGNRQTESKW